MKGQKHFSSVGWTESGLTPWPRLKLTLSPKNPENQGIWADPHTGTSPAFLGMAESGCEHQHSNFILSLCPASLVWDTYSWCSVHGCEDLLEVAWGGQHVRWTIWNLLQGIVRVRHFKYRLLSYVPWEYIYIYISLCVCLVSFKINLLVG